MRETERAVAEARGVVRDAMIATHEFTCGKVKKVRNKWVVDRLVRCSCGSDDNLQSHLDALIAAVRSDERARHAPLVQALEPFATFWRQWQRMPMRGIDDEFYAIHTGTPYEASLRRSDCERAALALDAARVVKPQEDV